MEARSFPDAIRVAKRHLPHKLAEVNAEIESAVAGGGHDYVATGRMWEESRNWSLAIDACVRGGGGGRDVSRRRRRRPVRLLRVRMAPVAFPNCTICVSECERTRFRMTPCGFSNGA